MAAQTLWSPTRIDTINNWKELKSNRTNINTHEHMERYTFSFWRFVSEISHFYYSQIWKSLHLAYSKGLEQDKQMLNDMLIKTVTLWLASQTASCCFNFIVQYVRKYRTLSQLGWKWSYDLELEGHRGLVSIKNTALFLTLRKTSLASSTAFTFFYLYTTY